MVPLRVQLAKSTLRRVIERLHFPLEIMLVCVRWYAAYPLSLRNLEEMMAECRQTPEVGAQCVSCAGWDLCGGCPVTGIPTAIAPTDLSGCSPPRSRHRPVHCHSSRPLRPSFSGEPA